MSEEPDVWAPLDGEKYMQLETFKRNGDGVKTPVWFARDGDALTFMTNGGSWKVKRLSRDARCRVAACNFNGKELHSDWLDGTCHRIDDPDDIKRLYRALSRKYLSLRIANPLARLFGRAKQRAWYRITPRPA